MSVYKIIDKEIRVSTGIENAYYIRKAFSPYIEQSIDMFKKWYSSQYSCERVWDNRYSIKYRIAQPITERALEILKGNGIYTIDFDLLNERFLNNCFDEFEDNVYKMIQRINGIDISKDQMAAYRRDRKASRGRVVGGGFGLSGAVKGMATAGAMNAATGLAHTAVNVVGNIGSGIAASADKSQVFSSYKAILAKDISDFVWNVMSEMRSILKSERNMSFEFQSAESKDKGDAIYNNYIKGNIPDNQKLEALVQALSLNYYNEKIYQRIWLDFGDPTSDLFKMASFFDISLSKYITQQVKNYGDKMCNEYCSGFISSKNKINDSIKYEDDIKTTIEKIELFCTEHNVSSENCEIINIFNSYLNMADKLKKTVEGVVFDSITEAQNIKHDICVFNDILNQKNIYDADAFEAVSNGKYLSDIFVSNIQERFNCERVLRNPSYILSSIYALTVQGNSNKKTKSIFGIRGKCGNIEETQPIFEQICDMQPNETPLAIIDRSVGLFNNKGKGKSGILFTNLNLRIFSKQLLAKENVVFDLKNICAVEALGENEYLLKTHNDSSYKFDVHLGEFSIEEQNFLADLIYRTTQLIQHIYADQRVQLDKILNPDGVKCICGKYVLKSEKLCSYCHRFVDLKGTFTDSMNCPNCKEYVKVSAKFCSHCGHNMAGNLESSDLLDINFNERLEKQAETFKAIEMINCRICGTENNSNKSFCKHCGSKLQEEMIVAEVSTSNDLVCKHCGSTIKLGKRFCSKCGNTIRN